MFKKFVIFGLGAAIGYASGYFLLKKKFKKIADEEIESMREYYEEKLKNGDEKALKKEEPKKQKEEYLTTNNLSELQELYSSKHNTDVDPGYYSSPYPFEEDSPTEGIAEEPYTITAEQFVNEKRNFEKTTLLYFEGNGVLCEDTERIIEDIDSSIGRQNLDKFGEFEEDVAYVRNERLGIDYEVLLQHETYKPPYPTGEPDIY